MLESKTLILSGNDVRKLLPLGECINAVEHAFKLYSDGNAIPPKVLGLHTENGGFHIKAGMLDLQRNYFVTKINSNYPSNQRRFGLPLIQGVVAVFDGENGKLLALLDSIEITIIRTGAATAVAAKYLSKIDSNVITICGCGNQGRISLKAINEVRQLKKVFAFDINNDQMNRFTEEISNDLNLPVIPVDDLTLALRQSHICVTCTTSTKYFIEGGSIIPGTFIAAVGADSEQKQEIAPGLISSCKLVVDILDQSATIGELHHALDANLTTIDKVHAELGEVITGKKAGRQSDDEIIIFDSTGMALQDVAAAAIVYERAIINKIGSGINFSDTRC
jgi:alanine dehydrogenase